MRQKFAEFSVMLVLFFGLISSFSAHAGVGRWFRGGDKEHPLCQELLAHKAKPGYEINKSEVFFGIYMNGNYGHWLDLRNSFYTALHGLVIGRARGHLVLGDLNNSIGEIADFMATSGPIVRLLYEWSLPPDQIVDNSPIRVYRGQNRMLIPTDALALVRSSYHTEGATDGRLQFGDSTFQLSEISHIFATVHNDANAREAIRLMGEFARRFFKDKPEYLNAGYSPVFSAMVYQAFVLTNSQIREPHGDDRNRKFLLGVLNSMMDVTTAAFSIRGEYVDVEAFRKFFFARMYAFENGAKDPELVKLFKDYLKMIPENISGSSLDSNDVSLPRAAFNAAMPRTP